MSRIRALAFLLILVPLIVACGGGGSNGASQVGSAASDPRDPPATLKRAYVKLTHTPAGSITLTWTPSDHTLTISLDLYGFAANSTHPAQIYSGSCETGGPVRYDLGTLAADGQGRITQILTHADANDGIPAQGWYLAVQNAAGDNVYTQIALACVNLNNANTNTNQQQVIHTTVTSGFGPSMGVTGEATFEIEDGKLVIVATLAGLEPFSSHPLYIAVGDCAHLGASAFSFYPAQADNNARAKIKQSFDGVAVIPAASWSLVVVRGVHLASQIDAAPIVCGDAKPIEGE
ncbi:MAG TPA: hypothetical protein VHR15_02615 [Ktedonobacterales bacterium]|nr:hypothetical protein [Ktedonobacterales bacterium]